MGGLEKKEENEFYDDDKHIYESIDRFQKILEYFWAGVPYKFNVHASARFECDSSIPGYSKLTFKGFIINTSSSDESELDLELDEVGNDNNEELDGGDSDEESDR
tara:strand:- start:269 stop:583 length:315 start_codon:yes stop_codon:yes gene_type:complete